MDGLQVAASALAFLAAGVLTLAVARLWTAIRARFARVEREFAEELRNQFLPVSRARPLAWLHVGGPVASLGLLGLALGRPVLGLAVAAASVFVVRAGLKYTGGRRLDLVNRQTPEALSILANGCRAGMSLAQAVAMVAEQAPSPIRDEFRLIAKAVELGDSLEDAIQRVRRRLALPYFDLAATALIVNREKGGDVTTLLGTLSDSIRRISEMEDKVEAETAAVRLSAKLMLATIPVFALVLAVLDPEAMALLFDSLPGNLILILVALLAFAGYRMIARLANPDL